MLRRSRARSKHACTAPRPIRDRAALRAIVGSAASRGILDEIDAALAARAKAMS
jgi:hypothetical protein